MKKVVLLAPTPPPAGGIAGWTARMLKARLKNEWMVVVVDEKSIGAREVFGKSGKRHLTDEIRRCFKIWTDLKKALKNPETKVVHSCIPSYTLSMLREYVCAKITKRYKRKFIIHFRCTVPNSVKKKHERYILKKICDISDTVFSLNKQSSDFLSTITKTPIRIIPNFISESELIQERQINEELKKIIYVGGLVEDKGIRDIMGIAKNLPDIQFKLVGKGDNQFEQEAKTEGITNLVFSGGMDRDGVRRELQKADAFIFMTHFTGEGFSNSLCEAMAAGLPCIVTDWAANRDMIENKGGIVVDVGDIDAAVDAINTIRNNSIRRAMSDYNINKVRSEYIETVVVDKYINEYDKLIGEY